MKNILKILFIIFIILSLFILFSNSIIVNAGTAGNPSIPDMSEIYTTPSGAELVNSRASEILGYISIIGFAAGVVTIAIIGIRYLYASPDGKADLKKQMMPYFVGAILLTSGGILAKMIIDVAITFK